MTSALAGGELADRLKRKFPQAAVQALKDSVLIDSKSLLPVVAYLKAEPELEFNYLNSVTAVDYYEKGYFELVYHLSSLEHNQMVVLKTRLQGRDNLAAASLTSLYRGADFQEREIFDLMGIRFEGHPNMKRIVLWEGFQGHPLRKDYLQ